MRRLRPLNVALLTALCTAAVAHRAQAERTILTGPVLRVLDCKTLLVGGQRKRVKVALHGVECPDKPRAIVQAARKHLSQLVAKQDVRVRAEGPIGKDGLVGKVTFRRTEIVEIYRSGKVEQRKMTTSADLAREMVRAGLARHDTAQAPDHKGLAAMEADARAAGRGIWEVPARSPDRRRRAR